MSAHAEPASRRNDLLDLLPVRREPSALSTAAIDEYAARVVAAHPVTLPTGWVDVDALAGTLGAHVRPALDGLPVGMVVAGRGRFTVYLPRDTSARRDRFLLAHCLGHYFLHYLYPGVDGPAVFVHGPGENGTAEVQANVFAAGLLMPAEAFTSAYRHAGGDPWRVSAAVGVSPAAVLVRAGTLQLTAAGDRVVPAEHPTAQAQAPGGR